MERRRANRVVLPQHASASLRLMQDVYLERIDGGLITVLADGPPSFGDDFILEWHPEVGRRPTARVELLRTSAVPDGDLPGHRMVFRIIQSLSGNVAPSHRTAADMPVHPLAVLIRRLDVRVIDISTLGCLVACAAPLHEGTIGVVDVRLEDRHNLEPLRICRARRTSDMALPWQAGGEFLPAAASLPTAVRNVLARLEIALELDAVTLPGQPATYLPPAIDVRRPILI